MNFQTQSRVSKKESLCAFFESTGQDNLDFLGEDVRVVFWSYELKKDEWLVTDGLEKVFGYSLEELANFDFLEIPLYPQNQSTVSNLHFHIKKQVPINLEHKIIRKDGVSIWLKTKGNPVFDSQMNLIRYNGATHDITEKVKKEIALAEEAVQYQTLLERSAQAVYISQDGKYQYATQQMAEITGYTVEELVGMNFNQILDDESIQVAKNRVETFLKGETNGIQEITIIKKDKSKRIVELRSSMVTYKEKPALMGTLLDITEKKSALERASYLAYYDMLTGLPNRNLFYKKFHSFLKEAKKNGTYLALAFIKLNKIKTINDTFGHFAGDEVIKETGAKIKELTPESGFIGKYGDEEFVAFFGYNSTEEIQEFANSVIRELPLSLSNDIRVKPIIGISLFPEHGDTPETLLRFSDIAMSQSKYSDSTHQNYNFYNPQMMEKMIRTNKLTNDLSKGKQLNQFHLVYQPKLWLASEKLEGVEALIRWEHPEYGNISPIEFIPLAEKSGDIIEIGEWVLETAIRDMQQMKMPLTLNVNVSMRQLLQPSFTEKVKALVEKSGFPPTRLNLEITESVVIFDIEQTIEKLHQLRDLGIKISLDDFGTGYSSLSYLTKLPIDCLKIDRSFVNQIEVNNLKKKLIQNIIQGARSLKMEVVAEGIETREQAEILHSFSCGIAQGYYFSKPLPFSALLTYIQTQE